jgi:hypothetical protein
MLNAALGFVSPGFESGDLGYLSRTDAINYHVGTGYKWNDPTPYYRDIEVLGSYFASSDFGGNLTWRGLLGKIYYQFPNYHSFEWYYDYGFESVDNRRTRGGPLMLNLPAYEYGVNYYTDSRNDYIEEAYWYAYEGFDGFYHNLSLYLTMRPSSNVSITIGPGYTLHSNKAQWVDVFSDPNATLTYLKRYIFADLNYKEISAQIRLNWTFTPTLSIQMFVQPLFATGNYTNFKEFARPRSFDFNVFGKNGSFFADSTFSDGSRKIYLDPDGTGPAPMISMDHPNFSKVSLRGNAVLRWEYMPGSTLFFVWTQSRFDNDGIGNFEFRHSFDRLIDTRPDNIFMIKLTYWLGG